MQKTVLKLVTAFWLCAEAALTLACNRRTEASTPTVERFLNGDTVTVLSKGSPQLISIDSVKVFWQSPELERLGAMVATRNRLFVADRDRIHVLGLTDGSASTVGRNGEGPGEYRLIWAMGNWRADSVVVFDATQRRFSILGPDGEYSRFARYTPTQPFMEPRVFDGRLLSVGPGVMWVRSTYMDERQEVSTRLGVIWQDIDADTGHVYLEADDLHFMSAGQRHLASRTLFLREIHVAIASTGDIAYGDGLEYCINVSGIWSNGPSRNERICRDVDLPPIGKGVRSPDFSDLPIPATDRSDAYSTLRRQHIPPHLPAYDELVFDSEDRLWVGRLDPELAAIHPLVLGYHPERGSQSRAWDVFDGTQSLVATVELPRTFTPRVILKDRAFGPYELASGEIVVGLVPLPMPGR